MDELKHFLQSVSPVPEAVLDGYLGSAEEVRLPRRHILTAEGQVQRHICFVLEGVQKSYYLAEGKEHVIAFTYPPSLTGIPESFFAREPSRYFLETITESRLLRLSFEQHEAAMQEHRELETLSRRLTELILGGLVQRLHELMAHDMETRFTAFVRRSPHLLQMVNHKDIASYLRMDPTNFSRLLGRIRI